MFHYIKKIKFPNQIKIIYHILVWLVIFSIPIINLLLLNAEFEIWIVVFIVTTIGMFYYNYFFTVPNYLLRKKTFHYILLLIPALLLFTFILNYFEPERIIPSFEASKIPLAHFDPNKNPMIMRKNIFGIGMKFDLFMFKIFPKIILFLLITSTSTLLRLFVVWKNNQEKQIEIETENKVTQLNFLKSQLNPHFFFNSLNTIYSLSMSKSPKTSEAILNLSELMRYMIRETKNEINSEKAKLTDELEYIYNYIELQKLRLTEHTKVDFKISGNTDNKEIYPLLLISFIENAFKFGINPIKNSKIIIHFLIENNFLEFIIINDVYGIKNTNNSFGLGTSNSIKRINLLYPDNILEIKNSGSQYSVYLKINLDEN